MVQALPAQQGKPTNYEEVAPQDGDPAGPLLHNFLSTGLYRRLRDFTVSDAFALRILYCQLGILPYPEYIDLGSIA